MRAKEYLRNPTGASALSFWKTCNFNTPAHIKVLNENEFNPNLLETHTDEVYFKLVHYLIAAVAFSWILGLAIR